MSKPRPCISSTAAHEARPRLRWASIEDSVSSRSLQTPKDRSSSASTVHVHSGVFCRSFAVKAERSVLAQYPRVTASGAWPHVAAKHAETQNVCGEESAGARPVWSVRETVLCEAERTSVQRPRRAVLAEIVNTL